MTRKVELVRHLPESELEKLYLKEKNVRVRERLHALLLLYRDYQEKDVAEILRRGTATVRRWKNAWNSKGYEGLNPKFKGGYAPRISVSTWDRIIDEIKDKGMSLKEVQVYVNTKYGANYGYTSIWQWVRKKKRVPYRKLYPQDSRRPEDAEERLKKIRGGA